VKTLDLALSAALGRGDPEEAAALIAAGADVHYRLEGGYGAALDAVHGRDVLRDPRLLDVLRLLAAHGVDLDRVSDYRESALRVLSHMGRFDAVRLLLEAGADRAQLQWTPLIEAVALGSLDDVRRQVEGGAALEDTDWWSRTAWLVAVTAGDIAKARLLRDAGANVDARGLVGMGPLSYAVGVHHADMVRWLIDIGQDANQARDYGVTPLLEAVEGDDLSCVDALLAAGAAVDHVAETGSVLGHATSKEIVLRLLAAGADPRRLSHAGHRALCGLGEVVEGPVSPALAAVSAEEFRRACTRRFGTANPERISEPFWEAMIRTGVSAYQAAMVFDPESPHAHSPVWSAMRFGQSITMLPDGRVVQIAGEHEDHYDADFCIYNDVFVHGRDGSITILGYPEAVFPPTDFHTATLMDDAIYVIGSLGYLGSRRYGETPVYRLDLDTFRIDRVPADGEAPGWIYEHRAVRRGPNEIRLSGGKVVTAQNSSEAHTDNADTFVLDVQARRWRRER
jgi:hypothetical protein